jgi:flavin-dependent dehydrogenase
MQDVIVIGAGPAGCAAAKRCAENGLNTLLLEKAELPRDKVCSGMIMGEVAESLVRSEFGEIPANVLAKPGSLSGYEFHVPGGGSARVENRTPLTWRRDLDYWMSQQAVKAGVKLLTETRAVAVRPDNWGFVVLAGKKDDSREPIGTRYVIVADGGNSTGRSFIYPELEPRYLHVLQECYRLELDLSPEYIHWFYPPEHYPGAVTVHHKDGNTVIDYGADLKAVTPLRDWARGYLAEHHGLDPDAAPVWEGACLSPMLLGKLLGGSFIPAQNNALLVGDAAGIILPSGEGIGTALKTGLAAADAVVAADKAGELAYFGYLQRIEGIVEALGEMVGEYRKVAAGFKAGADDLPGLLAAACRATLRPY